MFLIDHLKCFVFAKLAAASWARSPPKKKTARSRDKNTALSRIIQFQNLLQRFQTVESKNCIVPPSESVDLNKEIVPPILISWEGYRSDPHRREELDGVSYAELIVGLFSDYQLRRQVV